MGTDCAAIAKKKDGTYIECHFDRAYCFDDLNDEEGRLNLDHEGLFILQERVDDRCTGEPDDLNIYIKWCLERLKLLNGEGDYHHNKDNLAYWVYCYMRFLRYLRLYYRNHIEFVEVCTEHSGLYEKVVLNLDDDIEKIKMEVKTYGRI